MIKARLLHVDILAGTTELADELEDFYTNTLGLELKRKDVEPGKSDIRFIGNKNEENGMLVEIVGDLSEEGGPTHFQGNTAHAILKKTGPCLDHLALEVDDIDYVCEILRKKGITIEAEPYDFLGFIRMAWFRDPAGIPVELIQYVHKPDYLRKS